MMEKILHERLRAMADGIDCEEPRRELGYEVDDEHGKRECAWCSKGALEAIADEIERYYIPRPRFEDGEPLKNGDKIDYESETVTVIDYLISSKAWTNMYGITFQWVTLHLNDGRSVNVLLEDQLKRPTPKVCDADGVEIKVGDTVWTSHFNCSFTVDRISKNSKGETLVMVKEMGSGLNPDYCYHEKPVFDAEGMRICKGDTVYDVDGINPEPMRVLSYGDALVNVMSKSGIEKSYEFNELTHREPDSLEKLLDDISRFYSTDPEAMRVTSTWYQRIEALIERGA